jgi:LCP family protein required for cell wall assembly
MAAPPVNGRASARRLADPGGREPTSGAPVEATDSGPPATPTAAPEPPTEVAPEDRTELLFGKDELSDATVLLTKLERLGLPEGTDSREPTDDRDGPSGPERGGKGNGSWFTPVLGETTPTPADPFTDTTVLPPEPPAAPPSGSVPASSRPDQADDSAETAIIERADGGPYPVDHDGTIDDGSTHGEHDEADDAYADYREHDDYDVDEHQRDDEPVHDRADDVGQDDDELPQLTSFGVRDTSDKLTTPQRTDKTAAADARDEADVPGKTGEPGEAGEPGTAGRDPGTAESATAAGADKSSGPEDRDSAARDAIALRTAKIDETLSRLTAIHAGLGDELAERVGRTDRTRSTTKGTTRSGTDKASGAPDGRERTGGSKTGGPKADTPKGLGRILRSRRSRVTAIVLVALLLLTPAVGFGCAWWLNGKLRTVDALDSTGAGVIDAASQVGDQNYLVVAAGDDDLPQTVVIAHLPAKTDRAVLLSAPANLVVDRPGCERYDSANRRYSGDTVPAQSAEPLADAFEQGGPRCLVTTLQRLTGMPINHFIQLDPAGITPMVDAVNGVPMCVSDRVDDAVLGAVVPTPGQQMMNGEQAKAYATAREVRGEPTDGSGLRLRQQRVLSALLTKASALSPFLHLPTVASLAGALGAHSYVSGTDLGELAALGDALTAIDQTKVDYVPVPTADEADTQGNTVLRPTEAAKLFSAMRTDRPLDGEGDSASSTDGESAGLPPSAVTLSVLNGSSHAGVAGKAADSLRGVGFTVTSVRDSRHQDGGSSVIRASADQAAGSTTLARAVPGAIVQTVPGTGVLELVLGDSFDGQVQAAPGSTTAGPSLVTAAALACH